MTAGQAGPGVGLGDPEGSGEYVSPTQGAQVDWEVEQAQSLPRDVAGVADLCDARARVDGRVPVVVISFVATGAVVDESQAKAAGAVKTLWPLASATARFPAPSADTVKPLLTSVFADRRPASRGSFAAAGVCTVNTSLNAPLV